MEVSLYVYSIFMIFCRQSVLAAVRNRVNESGIPMI